MCNGTEQAWAAGFFDGEGCTHLLKYKNGRLGIRMVVVQTNSETIERFHAAVGGFGRIYGAYSRPGRPNEKPIYRWQANGAACTEVAAKLFPYLSTPKQEQMLEVIQASMENLETRKVTNPSGRKKAHSV